MKNIFLMIIFLFLSQTLKGQNMPNIDSVRFKLGSSALELGGVWDIKKKNDSTLVLTYHKVLKFAASNVRRTLIMDSRRYKLYLIFRAEQKTLKHHITRFKAIMKKLNHNNESEFKSHYYGFNRKVWQKLAPTVIPPMIVFPHYSIVIFDNSSRTSFNTHVTPYQEYLEAYYSVNKVIRFLGDEGITCSYQKYIPIPLTPMMIGFFDLIHWGALKKLNYPMLFSD